jgi:hypothetical protein
VAIAAGSIAAAGAEPRAGVGMGAVAVVASIDVPVDGVTMTELRRLFLLERRFWKPGQPATALHPPAGTPARESFLRHLSRSDERELRRLMLEKLYRGEIDLAPKVMRSDAEAVAFVVSGRGLLALVPAALAESAAVKVLRVDGRLPGERAYPLSE